MFYVVHVYLIFVNRLLMLHGQPLLPVSALTLYVKNRTQYCSSKARLQKQKSGSVDTLLKNANARVQVGPLRPVFLLISFFKTTTGLSDFLFKRAFAREKRNNDFFNDVQLRNSHLPSKRLRRSEPIASPRCSVLQGRCTRTVHAVPWPTPPQTTRESGCRASRLRILHKVRVVVAGWCMVSCGPVGYTNGQLGWFLKG